MRDFLELTLEPQRDSFGEKRRHFDLVAAKQISLKTDEKAFPFTGKFVHRQTKQNPYSRAQTLVMQVVDMSYYHGRGIPFSQLGPNQRVWLYDNSNQPAVATARVTRRWWEPATRQDFPEIEPIKLEERIPLSLEMHFEAHELAWLYLGRTPKSQEDRWLAYSQRPWLYLYRSWSSKPVFMVSFDLVGKIDKAFVFPDALKEGVEPESMASSLKSYLRQTAQTGNYILDTSEAKTAVLRGR